MMDMTTTVVPKSDQMNADDLIGKTRTIKVTRVHITAGDEQPVSIFYEGDGGKPFKPCKSMRRVLINAWGGDGNAYVGRRMTLHRDDKVVFGGMAVGGIRISHVSDIAREMTMALTDKRGSRKPYIVKPLSKDDGIADDVARLIVEGDAAASKGMDALKGFWSGLAATMKKACGGEAQLDKWKKMASEASTKPSTDWDNELDMYRGDLGECEDIRAIDARIAQDGARFTDAPDDVQARAREVEAAERARVGGGK